MAVTFIVINSVVFSLLRSNRWGAVVELHFKRELDPSNLPNDRVQIFAPPLLENAGVSTGQQQLVNCGSAQAVAMIAPV